MSHLTRGVLSFTAVLFVQSESLVAQQVPDRVAPISLRETAIALARAGAANGHARVVLAAAQLMVTAERPSPGIERVNAQPDSARREELQKMESLSAIGLLRMASRIAVGQNDVGTARVAAQLAAQLVAERESCDTIQCEQAQTAPGPARRVAEELRRAADALAATRGATGGPIWTDGHLAAGETATYRISFEGGRVPNRINVSASRYDADLDCYLYDGDRLVARDAAYRGDCAIEWSQRFEGALTLRIRNVGATTYYLLASN